jgi:hypothetical protein
VPLSPDLIDEEQLPQAIANLLGISETDAQQPEAASRIAEIELMIDEARALGRLTRYSRQLEKSGVVVGHVYKRADIARFLRQLPGPQAATPNAAA